VLSKRWRGEGCKGRSLDIIMWVTWGRAIPLEGLTAINGSPWRRADTGAAHCVCGTGRDDKPLPSAPLPSAPLPSCHSLPRHILTPCHILLPSHILSPYLS
jgi:hypothetical protein